MNTQNRLDEIAEELRDIYNNDNDGPRLIGDMIDGFPKVADAMNAKLHAEKEELEARVADLRDEVSELESTADRTDLEIVELNSTIEDLRSEITSLGITIENRDARIAELESE